MLLQIKALGATKLQTLSILLKQTKIAIVAAIMAGFGRVIAEVGAAMMVGGNIKGDTTNFNHFYCNGSIKRKL